MRFNDLNEMDSQGYSGSRDRKSSSKYGSRDDYELGQGKERTGKPLTAKQMIDRAHNAMMKSMSNAEKVDKGWRNPNVDEGSEEDYKTQRMWDQHDDDTEDLGMVSQGEQWGEMRRAKQRRLDKDQQGVAEGAGNVGNAIKSLYQKIYNAGDDEIEYFYNDSPIFAQYWDEYEGDLDSIIAEVDPKELQIMHDELESYVQQANLAEANPTMTVNKKSALSQAVAEAGWGRRYTSYHDELSSRDRDEQNYMDQSKRAFKRAEMQHELGHEDDPNFERNFRQQQIDRDRGPWYIRIDGKIYKQKGIAKSFDWKRGANNYALAMIKNNPSLQGKVMLSKSAEDK